ncbi:MAG: hypothetical protein ACWGON_08685 [Gemmatimonadota bacterium]
MKSRSFGWWALSAVTLTLVFGACADDREYVTDTAVFAKKDCPPGSDKKGECEEPPPPPPPPGGTVEPDLPGVSPDVMHTPMRLAGTPEGRMLAADPKSRMILRVDPAYLLPDQGFEALGKPLSVALLGDAIFVGNAEGKVIDVYDAIGGGYRSSFGAGRAERPADLVADTGLALLFVLDSKARQVTVFEPDGTMIRTISAPGSGAGQLASPVALGLDPVRGELLVSDYGTAEGTASVKIFSYDGTYVGFIDGAGTCNFMGCRGGFSRPQGVFVRGDQVFVTDGLLATVEVFSRTTLAKLATLGGRNTGFPELRFPTDVVVNAAGDVFAASYQSGSVDVFVGGAP